jgi:chemotaxis protein methyltransferase CheR
VPAEKAAQIPKQASGAPKINADARRSGALDRAARHYDQGKYREAAETLIEEPGAMQAPEFSLLARSFANQGKLGDAMNWCDQWVAADKVDAFGHYFRGIISLEQGEEEEARRSLLRSLFLKADFVLAHFALGNLSRRAGKSDEADKHFKNALKLLATYSPNDLLPEAEGLTAGRLTETITSLIAATAGGGCS